MSPSASQPHFSSRAQAKLTAQSEQTSTSLLYHVLSNQYSPANPTGIAILGIAENALMSRELTSFYQRHFTPTAHRLTYGDGPIGSLELRRNLASYINRVFEPVSAITHDNIYISAGVSAVVDQLAWALADEGEGILIGKPLYGGFLNDLEGRSKVKPVLVSLQGLDPFGLEAVRRYEEVLERSGREGCKIRALILCNPHNPLGKAYPRETVKAYMRLCQKHRIHLIADEVYVLSSYSSPENSDAVPFESVLKIGFEGLIDPELVHVLYGMSKDFSSNGLRAGAMITHNTSLFRAMSSISLFAWPSSASDGLWATLLSPEHTDFLESYTVENQKRLSAAYAIATEFLQKHGIEYVRGSKYGFFVWIDLRFAMGNEESELQRERALTKRMVENGVYLATGETFGAEELGWYRLTFSVEEQLLRRGLRRLLWVLKPGSEEGEKLGKAEEGERVEIERTEKAVEVEGKVEL